MIEEGKKRVIKFWNIKLYRISDNFLFIEKFIVLGWFFVSGVILKVLVGKVFVVYDFIEFVVDDNFLEENIGGDEEFMLL